MGGTDPRPVVRYGGINRASSRALSIRNGSGRLSTAFSRDPQGSGARQDPVNATRRLDNSAPDRSPRRWQIDAKFAAHPPRRQQQPRQLIGWLPHDSVCPAFLPPPLQRKPRPLGWQRRHKTFNCHRRPIGQAITADSGHVLALCVQRSGNQASQVWENPGDRLFRIIANGPEPNRGETRQPPTSHHTTIGARPQNPTRPRCWRRTRQSHSGLKRANGGGSPSPQT